MYLLLPILLFLINISLVPGLNVLLMFPGYSRSHTLFNERMAQVLATHHNLTVIGNYFFDDYRFHAPKGVKEYRIFWEPADPKGMDKIIEMLRRVTFEDYSMNDMRKIMPMMNTMPVEGCSSILHNTELIQLLETTKFDIIVGHCYSFCPVGIAAMYKIPIIWASAGTYIHGVVIDLFGLPAIASVVPDSMLSTTDVMTFWERVKTVYAGQLQKLLTTMWFGAIGGEQKLFDPWNIDLWRMSTLLPTYVANGEMLLDFSRPLAHSIFYMGDLGGKPKEKSEISNRWQQVFQNSKQTKGIILFSLGSIAKTEYMTVSQRDSFFGAFRALSEYTIIWKYHGNFTDDAEMSHIITDSWIPQRDILGFVVTPAMQSSHNMFALAQPNTILFITHGGYNSLLEAVGAAKPLLLIPLFGDQYSNAKRAERHGFAVILSKTQLTNDSVLNSIRTVVDNPSYRERAQRLSGQINSMRQFAPPADKFVHRVKKDQKYYFDDTFKLKLPRFSVFKIFDLDILLVTVLIISTYGSCL